MHRIAKKWRLDKGSRKQPVSTQLKPGFRQNFTLQVASVAINIMILHRVIVENVLCIVYSISGFECCNLPLTKEGHVWVFCLSVANQFLASVTAKRENNRN